MTDLSGYDALRNGVGGLVLERDVIEAAGPDTLTYLQGQLSQDIAALADGESAWSLLLQPKGKVDAWLRVSRIGPERFLLDVDHGFGEATVARLSRFKLRTKCELTPLDWKMVSLRGPDAAALAAGLPDGAVEVVAPAEWPGSEGGVDLLGPAVALPAGVAEASCEAFEALRIECGIPLMGFELDETIIPAAAGIVARSASFTKGCYTGQELVARVDSRGSNTPTNLRGIRFAAGADIAVGTELTAAGDTKVVGTCTSVTASPLTGGVVALAYVGRAVSVGDTVTAVDASGQKAEAVVSDLPLTAS